MIQDAAVVYAHHGESPDVRQVPADGALPAVIYARISNDPGSDRSGVDRQVRQRLEQIGADPRYALMTIDGSPVDPRRRRRRHRDPETHQLVPLPPRDTTCWPPGVLVDDDISAAARDGVVAVRPEYNRLVDLCKSGKCQVIYTRDLNRLWRDPEQFYAFQRETGSGSGKRHITVVTDSGTFELWGDVGPLIAGLLAVVGKWYVDTTVKNQRGTTRDAALAGAAHGRAPFGYRLMHRQPDGGMHAPVTGTETGTCPPCQGRRPARWRTLVPDPREAAALADAARRVLAGETAYAVLGVLDEQWQTPTRTGLSWRQSGITSLKTALLNPAITGARAFTPGWDGSGHRPRGAETEIIPEAWPGIITWDQHEALVALLTDPARNPNTWDGRAGARHLLTGLAECGLCHGPMFVQHNRSRPRYTCLSADKLGHVIRRQADVEAETERVILSWMADGGLYDIARRSAESGEVKELEAKLAEAKAERTRLFRNATAFGLSDDEVRAEAAPVVAEITSLEVRLAAARTYDALADVPERGEAFAAGWETWDLAKRRRITAELISRVEIYPAPRRGGKAADPRYILPWPAGWAKDLPDPADAAPPPPPDAEAATSRARVLTWLTEHYGLFSVAEIAAGTGLPPYTVKAALGKLHTAGDAGRQWCAFGAALTRSTPDERSAILAAERAARGSRAFQGTGCYGWTIAGRVARDAHVTPARYCPVDGTVLTGTGAYCSPRCRSKAHYRTRTGKDIANPGLRLCEQCGGPIPPARPTHAKYCSDLCRSRHHEAARRR